MSDNTWRGDIEVRMDSAKAKRDIEDLEGRVRNLRGEFTKAGRHIDDFEGDIDHAAGSVGRLAGGLKTLDRNVHIGVGGLRDMGRAAQVAERQIQKLYQTYAAAQLAQKRVPQSMASWLPGSGVSQSTKDQVLGANTGTNSNVIAALRQEEKAREANIAAIKREKTARQELNATTAQEARYRQHGDQYGRLAEARLRDADAAKQQNDAYNRLIQTDHRNAEAARASQEAYSSATRNRIQSANNLRAAEEQHAQATMRSIEQQNKLRANQQKALTTAQGRLQAEEEAAAYRKLEGAVGRAEAAKRGLAAAQRQVNAAQQALKSATGDIVMQTAATNRLADAKRRLAQAETAARSAQQPTGNMDSTRYALYDVGATAGMAAAIGGLAIGATVKNFAGLETQFATVSRTSEETGHNLTVMTDRLLDMGSVIPIPLQGLTDMAARAAQLGVEGQKDILKFTEVMSKFAAISDTVTETEVAEYFGRLNNLTGNMGNWEEMADAVARVGITSAATDQQILKTAQEIAQAGAGANYSQKEIIGLAGAFASLAVPPERARSVLLDLNKIMTKGMGESTDSMKALSSQMGISEEAIRGMWRAKPTELISEMAKSLKDMEPEEVMTFLSDFGLKGARALPVFMAIAKDAKNAGDGLSVFDKAQQESANSAGELEKQFSITMETLAAAWQTFINSVQAGGFDAMNDIGPILTDVLNLAGDLMDWIREFLGTDIGGFIGNTVLVLGGLATALTAAGAGAAIFAASMLAIKSAAASGIFGAAAAQRVAAIGTAATGAGNGMLFMGRSATTSTQGVMMNTGRVQQAMDRTATAAGRAAGRVGNSFSTAAGNVGKVGSAAVGLLGGPIGATILLGTAVAGIATAAANAEASYQQLGTTITTVNEQTGASLGSADIFDAAEQNLRANYGWMIGAQDLLTGMAGVEDPWEFDVATAKEYIGYMKEGVKITTKGAAGRSTSHTLTGDAGARQGMGLQGEVTGAQFAEIGSALSKMDAASASVAFNQLSKDLGYTGENAAYLVQALGGDFSDAMWSAGTATGTLSGEMGGANQNLQIAGMLQAEYTASAQASKDAITQMNPALEDMEEGLQGTFAGLTEGAQAMTGYFSAMIGGAQGLDQMTAAFVGLGVANGETGELIKDQIDLYDEATGKWTLITAEQQAAVGSLSAYAGAQVAAIQGEYAMQSAILDKDVALANAQTKMDESRSTFLEYADTLGIGAEEAKRMADSLGLVEGQYLVFVDASSTTVASEQVQMVLDKVNAVPGAKQILMTTLSDEAKQKLIDLGFTVEGVEGEYTVTVTDEGTAAATQSAISGIDVSDVTKTVTVAYQITGDIEAMRQANQNTNWGPTGNTPPGGADGGYFGGGNSVKKFADGRYTGGGGGKWSPAGVVHKKEYVFPARAVDPSRGIPTQDALGRMMQQHYPQAMSPNIVVQGGGGNGGVVALDAGTMHQLARMVSTQVSIDSRVVASSVNGQNKTSAQRGSN